MITLDGWHLAGTTLILASVFVLAVGVAHETGTLAAAADPVLHSRCEGCGRNVCGCDPNQAATHPGTVLQGCMHQRVLCTDCIAECEGCRHQLACENAGWGDHR